MMRSRSSVDRLSASMILQGLVVLLACITSTVHARGKGQVWRHQSEAVVPVRSHSIHSPYVESSLQNKWWDYGGDAIVDTNRHIRLTQDKPHQRGWLWSRLPLAVPSYEITFEFNVDGAGSHTFGDGMALWLASERDRAQSGPVFGSKDYFTGLGIFIDTFANARHPYSFPRIMAMMGNGVESYRVDKDGANQELGGCSLDIRKTKVATKGRLTFVKDVYLELEIQYDEWDEWDSCFKLENVQMPETPYLGFSALTGDVSDAHDIVSVNTDSLVFKKRSYLDLEAERRKHFPKDGSEPAIGKSGRTQGRQNKGLLHGFFAGIYHVFASLFTVLFFVLKWGLVLAAIGGLVFLGLRWQKSRDAKRF